VNPKGLLVTEGEDKDFLSNSKAGLSRGTRVEVFEVRTVFGWVGLGNDGEPWKSHRGPWGSHVELRGYWRGSWYSRPWDGPSWPWGGPQAACEAGGEGFGLGELGGVRGAAGLPLERYLHGDLGQLLFDRLHLDSGRVGDSGRLEASRLVTSGLEVKETKPLETARACVSAAK